MQMYSSNSEIKDARRQAKDYETSLDPARRKRLGQFFTGLPLGRLLAAIALDHNASTVIDPMAGNGDLLDAILERAVQRGQELRVVDGVEIDPRAAEICRQRLATWRTNFAHVGITISSRDAFNRTAADQYLKEGYDLVITNPPYVRYQSLAPGNGAKVHQSPDEIRRNLGDIVAERVPEPEGQVWRTLIKGYSGLADLSVPAWILAAALVRPGGVLALVAPATWRSRDYGSAIEYLLARCFTLEYLIEDTQPGWFSNVLVRTQLVIARRAPAVEALVPLVDRADRDRSVLQVKVSPEASDGSSLVGEAFSSEDPEDAFADWLREERASSGGTRNGLKSERRALSATTASLFASLRGRTWFQAVEPVVEGGSLFSSTSDSGPRAFVPETLAHLFDGLADLKLCPPEDLGIVVGQGLRTGCNDFFYVDLVEELPDGLSRVRLSSLFDNELIITPSACLVPVIRRQSEVPDPASPHNLTGRALDLNAWVLPEDVHTVEQSKQAYAQEGISTPSTMPPELAAFVRRAADTVYRASDGAKRIPELSAVKTNVRHPTSTRSPRFWYMLPPFARRHSPDVFVARVNQNVPWVEANRQRVLIDANFSTIWGATASWTPYALQALLNSSWCRVSMEAIGTPLGGGALKLEATHLRRLPLPALTTEDLAKLDTKRKGLSQDESSDRIDRIVVERITGLTGSAARVTGLITRLQTTAAELSRSRQRRTI